jgi:hypothetical protein
MDPLAITQQDYIELHKIVNNIWLMLACAFSFSGNMLLAHAIIPSLLESGSVSKSWNKFRAPFYFMGFISATAYVGLAVYSIILGDVINNFWSDWCI